MWGHAAVVGRWWVRGAMKGRALGNSCTNLIAAFSKVSTGCGAIDAIIYVSFLSRGQSPPLPRGLGVLTWDHSLGSVIMSA